MSNNDKVLFESDWLAIKSTTGGYEYMSQMKSDAGVAVLAFRRNPMEFVGRYEECPPHRDGIALCSLTGMMDKEVETAESCAVRELYEEAGIMVGSDELISLGTIRPSKASDYTLHLFAVDIGDRDIGLGPGDGTEGEENAHCEWIGFPTAIQAKDPTLIAAVTRMALYDSNKEKKGE